MLFQLSEEHIMIQKAARDFANNECLPGVIERDELQKFPKEQITKLATLGFMGLMVKPEYGGSGMDTISYVLAMEEISKVDASVSVCMSVNNSLVCYGLQEFANEEQKQKYLVPLAQGKKDNELYIGAFLLSEPEAGSDATASLLHDRAPNLRPRRPRGALHHPPKCSVDPAANYRRPDRAPAKVAHLQN